MNWFITKQKAPAMYGPVHLSALFLIIAGAGVICHLQRHKNSRQIIRILFFCGVILLAMESAKQVFLFHINGYFNWWRFPFQICSMPMYLCLILPFAKEKLRKTILCYLDSFCFLGALAALLFPQDMLSVYPLMTVHSFLWHGILVLISALTGSHHMQGNWHDFLKACLLFLFLAGWAEFINFIGARMSVHTLPDMFYISPYTETLQPFFSQIQKLFGRKTEIMIYLLFYMLGCAGLHFLSTVLWKPGRPRQNSSSVKIISGESDRH